MPNLSSLFAELLCILGFVTKRGTSTRNLEISNWNLDKIWFTVLTILISDRIIIEYKPMKRALLLGDKSKHFLNFFRDFDKVNNHYIFRLVSYLIY